MTKCPIDNNETQNIELLAVVFEDARPKEWEKLYPNGPVEMDDLRAELERLERWQPG
jgi:hypothetical protein